MSISTYFCNFLIFGVLAFPPSAYSETNLSKKIPDGEMVLLDGVCEKNEWADSLVIWENEEVSILGKSSGEFLLFCIQAPLESRVIFNLFLDTDKLDAPMTLHSSAKLGERSLVNGEWQSWNWWNNKGWYSQVAKFHKCPREENPNLADFKPPRTGAKEIQVSLDRFGKSGWKFYFELMGIYGQDGQFKNMMIPENATLEEKSSWIQLEIN